MYNFKPLVRSHEYWSYVKWVPLSCFEWIPTSPRMHDKVPPYRDSGKAQILVIAWWKLCILFFPHGSNLWTTFFVQIKGICVEKKYSRITFQMFTAGTNEHLFTCRTGTLKHRFAITSNGWCCPRGRKIGVSFLPFFSFTLKMERMAWDN